MSRSRKFVPNFDLLGLRITPSDIASVATTSAPPGVDGTIGETITWILPDPPMVAELNPGEEMIAEVDWIIPYTMISTDG